MKNTQVFSLALLLSLIVATPAFVISSDDNESTSYFDYAKIKESCNEKLDAVLNIVWAGKGKYVSASVLTVVVAGTVYEVVDNGVSKTFNKIKAVVFGQDDKESEIDPEHEAILKMLEELEASDDEDLEDEEEVEQA